MIFKRLKKQLLVVRSKIIDKRSWRVIALVAVIVIAGIATLGLNLISPQPTSPSEADIAAYQNQLRSQVDTTDGAPRDGRDPASQPQGSLASAASQPTGGGQHVNKPAEGIGKNGCYIDYGKPGEQCLPVHAATNGSLTCDGVRKHFPDGVIVSGSDRFHLDKNHDGLACGAGD